MKSGQCDMEQQVFVQQFAPDQWSWARKFQHFMGPPFRITRELAAGTAAIVTHQERYELLGGIANEYAEKVGDDRQELERQGFTSAPRTRAFAASLEAMVADLYAILDGLRRVIFAIYRDVQGVQNRSTERLFINAANESYGKELPEPFRTALAQANSTWFPLLHQVRTLTTHGATGHCSVNRDTGMISYWHQGERTRDRGEVRIEDVISFGNETYLAVVELVEMHFEVFFRALAPVEQQVTCGVYKARFYIRMVGPTPEVSFDDGRCWSRTWFETAPGYECPMRTRCGAYHRPVSKEERDAYYARTKGD